MRDSDSGASRYLCGSGKFCGLKKGECSAVVGGDSGSAVPGGDVNAKETIREAFQRSQGFCLAGSKSRFGTGHF